MSTLQFGLTPRPGRRRPFRSASPRRCRDRKIVAWIGRLAAAASRRRAPAPSPVDVIGLGHHAARGGDRAGGRPRRQCRPRRPRGQLDFVISFRHGPANPSAAAWPSASASHADARPPPAHLRGPGRRRIRRRPACARPRGCTATRAACSCGNSASTMHNVTADAFAARFGDRAPSDVEMASTARGLRWPTRGRSGRRRDDGTDDDAGPASPRAHRPGRRCRTHQDALRQRHRRIDERATMNAVARRSTMTKARASGRGAARIIKVGASIAPEWRDAVTSSRPSQRGRAVRRRAAGRALRPTGGIAR